MYTILAEAVYTNINPKLSWHLYFFVRYAVTSRSVKSFPQSEAFQGARRKRRAATEKRLFWRRCLRCCFCFYFTLIYCDWKWNEMKWENNNRQCETSLDYFLCLLLQGIYSLGSRHTFCRPASGTPGVRSSRNKSTKTEERPKMPSVRRSPMWSWMTTWLVIGLCASWKWIACHLQSIL